jgi:cytosine/adenosine deaminase-related metal-dependent hydrolase
MMASITTISADWIVPVAMPPIANGVVSFVDDRVVYVGPADRRPIDQHFGRAVILPGLVNAHTHLDLTGAAGKTPPRLPFPVWLQSVIDYRRQHADAEQDLHAGARLCLEAGTTLIGDIAGSLTARRPLAHSKLRRVAYWELLGLTPDRCAQACADWRAAGCPPVSPHAPYSFHRSWMPGLVQHRPLVAIHIAESLEEKELLESQSGPFVPFLQALGVWCPDGLARSWAEVLQILSECSALIVHGNFLDPCMSISGTHTIVFCPRTHEAFGHPPHSFRQMLVRGARVVLGTDSLATNPDLSVLNEARFVAQIHPEFEHATLLHMITDWPAQALGQGGHSGSIAVGCRADFCVVETPLTDDPLAALFREATPIRAVVVGGDRVV